MYLDQVKPAAFSLSGGKIGVLGHTGWNQCLTSVNGAMHDRSISVKSPSRLIYNLDGTYHTFHGSVALLDNTSGPADFQVWVNGKLRASVPNVSAGEQPKELHVPLYGALHLELRVLTQGSEVDAIWINPMVDKERITHIVGPLGRVEAELPDRPIKARRAFVSVISPGYESYYDLCYQSLYSHGSFPDVVPVVFGYDFNDLCWQATQKYRAKVIPCNVRVPQSRGIFKKSIIYAMASILDVDQIIFLDADMLILADINEIWDTIKAGSEDTIWCSHCTLSYSEKEIGRAIRRHYRGTVDDLDFIGLSPKEWTRTTANNSGVIAGHREAFLNIESTMRSMAPNSIIWESDYDKCWWREDGLFGCAMALYNRFAYLDPHWNVQLKITEGIEVIKEHTRPRIMWNGKPVKNLHFISDSQYQMLEFSKKLNFKPKPEHMYQGT